MTDPRIQARRVEVQRQQGHRRLGLLLAVLSALALSAGALGVLHSRLFSARSVVISGAVHTTRTEVLTASGLNKEPPLLDVNAAAVSRRLERLAWVNTATVHIEWPSTVAISIAERVPVAASRLGTRGYAVFDATGRVLADEATMPAGIPLVAVDDSRAPPGTSLGAEARAELVAAAELPESLVSRVQEISTSRADGIVLELQGGLHAVVGDDAALGEKFVSLATVLSKVDLTGIGGIDLRVAAAPVLTPLVSASNVQGKGDG
jgi:cell division protein FtsQ